jgi:hypothetical protein
LNKLKKTIKMEEMRRLGMDLEPFCPFVLNLVREF